MIYDHPEADFGAAVDRRLVDRCGDAQQRRGGRDLTSDIGRDDLGGVGYLVGWGNQ